MKDQSRNTSGWIWRRFAWSYRSQVPPGVSTGTQYPWMNTGSVGLGLPWQAAASAQIIATSSNVENLQTAFGLYPSTDEIGRYQGIAGSQLNNFPVAGRRVAIKRIAGSFDIFPTALTFELGDALYVHTAIMKQRFQGDAVVPPNTAVGQLIGSPVSLYDRAGGINAPLWYRKHCWYYGGFQGSIQSSYASLKVNKLFRRPLVLDMEENLSVVLVADVQLSSPGLGVYFASLLPYLSFLCKVL